MKERRKTIDLPSLRVLVLGAGGHAQVVADVLFRMAEAGAGVTPIGYLDDDTALAGDRFLDLPVRGRISDLPTIPHDGVVVAIGRNATRRDLFEALGERGERFVVARHPGAIVAPDVPVGPGSVVGANVILNTGATVDHHNRVGDHAHVAPGVHLGGEVTVGEGALVGIGATVIPQCAVGAWAAVGAGSVVTRDVPDGATAVGVPARVVRGSVPGQG